MKVISHLAKPITDAMARHDLFVKSLFERPQSLSALLPYGEYLPETGVFVHKDGSLGAVFEATLLEHEPMVTEQVIEAVEGLKPWFNLPTQCVLQVLFEQTHLSALDRTFETIAKQYPGGSPVSKTLFDTRLRRLQAACNSEDPLAPLVRRCFVSLRFFPGSTVKASSVLMKRGESVLYDEMKGFIEASREFRQLVTNFQSNSKVPLRLLSCLLYTSDAADE